MSKLEGNGPARLIQLMRQFGHNTDVGVELGVIVSAPPSIKIRLENDGLELDNDDVIVGASVADKLAANDRVIILSANNGQQYYVIDKAVFF